jgi:serine/threonine-protein kinase
MVLPVSPGAVIAQGKYRIERLLGEGGMGIVVLATHIGFGDRVAIKLLRPEIAADSDAVLRFFREGRASRRIRSEHVVQVMDIGTLETGAPYMVMEFLEGEDLRERLRRTGPIACSEAVEIVLQACEAIAEAHAMGVVHRDLKPANLFCVARPGGLLSVKVLDFGISKISGMAGATSAALTQSSAAFGSPLYMSPEQLQSAHDVDARSDIWALGVILYELLTGARPFVAEDIPRLCIKIMTQPPAPVPNDLADLPPLIAAAVMRCLEKDPGRRFPDVAALARALEPGCNARARLSVDRIVSVVTSSGAPVVVSPPASSDTQSSDAQDAPTTTAPVIASPGAPRPVERGLAFRKALIGAGAAVALMVALGALGLLMLLGTNKPSATALPPPTATSSPISASTQRETLAPEVLPPPQPDPAPMATSNATAAASTPLPRRVRPATTAGQGAPSVTTLARPRVSASPPIVRPQPTIDDTL